MRLALQAKRGCYGILFAMAALISAAELPYKVVNAFPALSFELPVFFTAVPGPGNRLAVIEQDGRVWTFTAQAKQAVLALDITKKVRRAHNEEGLLGLAFHPKFAVNGRVFLYYSASNPTRNQLTEWRWQDDRIDPYSEQVLLELPKPYGNHNGGMLAFGPDGFLYLSPGDGGAGGDPHGNAQNLGSLLGKMLRIDVDRSPYVIPKDNPLRNRGGARPEIWAYGLRNAWRFSFDRKTGTLWAGDVGQDKWEEIDIIERGGNYGWNLKEGFHSYKGGNAEDLKDPVLELDRDVAQSVTGGYVYRGKNLPELHGQYIFGDFMSGNIWALPEGQKKPRLIAKGELISSFGEDAAGELYIVSFDGKIYRLAKKP